MIEKIRRLLSGRLGEVVRYGFFGGLTTGVEMGTFAVFFNLLHMDKTVSNVLSIACAILFAYVVNKWFVFKSHCSNARELVLEFLTFVSGRLVTFGIQVGGFELLVKAYGLNEYLGKALTMVLAIVGNYFISKFLAFRKRRRFDGEAGGGEG